MFYGVMKRKIFITRVSFLTILLVLLSVEIFLLKPDAKVPLFAHPNIADIQLPMQSFAEPSSYEKDMLSKMFAIRELKTFHHLYPYFVNSQFMPMRMNHGRSGLRNGFYYQTNAHRELERGNAERAMTLLRQALDQYDRSIQEAARFRANSWTANINKGIAHYELGEMNQANQLLQTALEKMRSYRDQHIYRENEELIMASALNYYALGTVLLESGDADHAIGNLKNALGRIHRYVDLRHIPYVDEPLMIVEIPRSDGLTNHMIYNDLVVAYTQYAAYEDNRPNLHSGSTGFYNEGHRNYYMDVDKNPFSHILGKELKETTIKHQGKTYAHLKGMRSQNWYWAISNMERLLSAHRNIDDPVILYNMGTLLMTLGYLPQARPFLESSFKKQRSRNFQEGDTWDCTQTIEENTQNRQLCEDTIRNYDYVLMAVGQRPSYVERFNDPEKELLTLNNEAQLLTNGNEEINTSACCLWLTWAKWRHLLYQGKMNELDVEYDRLKKRIHPKIRGILNNWYRSQFDLIGREIGGQLVQYALSTRDENLAKVYLSLLTQKGIPAKYFSQGLKEYRQTFGWWASFSLRSSYFRQTTICHFFELILVSLLTIFVVVQAYFLVVAYQLVTTDYYKNDYNRHRPCG